MDDVFLLEWTIFVLLALGFLAKRIRLVNREGQKNLTDLYLYMVLPCNILTSFLSGAGPDVLRNCMVIFAMSVGIQIFCVLYVKFMIRSACENLRI
jgi:predicted permease